MKAMENIEMNIETLYIICQDGIEDVILQYIVYNILKQIQIVHVINTHQDRKQVYKQSQISNL